MELKQQLIWDGLEKGELQIVLSEQAEQWIEGRCYRALQTIRRVLMDDSINDEECFMRIEGILDAFEEIGSNGGTRHDFG